MHEAERVHARCKHADMLISADGEYSAPAVLQVHCEATVLQLLVLHASQKRQTIVGACLV